MKKSICLEFQDTEKYDTLELEPDSHMVAIDKDHFVIRLVKRVTPEQLKALQQAFGDKTK
jgi:hypothetical protein